jgi:hypothetical protein
VNTQSALLAAEPQRVGARVEHEGASRGADRVARGGDAPRRQPFVEQAAAVAVGVLDVAASGTDGDRESHGLGHFLGRAAVAGFEIGGHRDRHRSDDAAYRIEHLVARHRELRVAHVVVGLAERERDAGAGRAERGEAHAGQHHRAAAVPGVGQHEAALGAVQREQGRARIDRG